MDKRALRIILFSLLCACQFAVLVWILGSALSLRFFAPVIRVECRLYDPYDPLEGRYLHLQPTKEEILLTNDRKLSEQLVDPSNGFRPRNAWVRYAPDSNGLWKPDCLFLKRPEASDGPFVPCFLKEIDSDRVLLVLPFDRYYLQEDLALKAEELLHGHFDFMPVMEISVGRKGNWAIKSLLVAGKPVENWVKEEGKTNNRAGQIQSASHSQSSIIMKTMLILSYILKIFS
jgi:hypothetical protein